MDVVYREGGRPLRLLGDTKAREVVSNNGPEQELFLIEREFYVKRPDPTAVEGLTSELLHRRSRRRVQQIRYAGTDGADGPGEFPRRDVEARDVQRAHAIRSGAQTASLHAVWTTGLDDGRRDYSRGAFAAPWETRVQWSWLPSAVKWSRIGFSLVWTTVWTTKGPMTLVELAAPGDNECRGAALASALQWSRTGFRSGLGVERRSVRHRTRSTSLRAALLSALSSGWKPWKLFTCPLERFFRASGFFFLPRSPNSSADARRVSAG